MKEIIEAVAALVLAAAECPADRPHAREVVIYPQTQTCTAMACPSVLRCPDPMTAQSTGAKCVLIQESCNRCTPEIETKTMCFTQEEIDNSMRK